MRATRKPRKEPVKVCSRCGGVGQYIIGPIINGVGRSLGACYKCGGNGINPKWTEWKQLQTPKAPESPHDSPEYQNFVEASSEHCNCQPANKPCDGVLAGGPCDNVQEPDWDEGADCPAGNIQEDAA